MSYQVSYLARKVITSLFSHFLQTILVVYYNKYFQGCLYVRVLATLCQRKYYRQPNVTNVIFTTVAGEQY
jgi:hypothetical protein